MEYSFKQQFFFAKSSEDTSMLQSLPAVLKETLFLNEKHVTSMRARNYLDLFFLANEVKDLGNKDFYQGRYFDALAKYTQVSNSVPFLSAGAQLLCLA